MSVRLPSAPSDFNQQVLAFMKNQSELIASQTAMIKEKDNAIKDLSEKVTKLTEEMIVLRQHSMDSSTETARKEVKDFIIKTIQKNEDNSKRIKEAELKTQEMNRVALGCFTMIGSGTACLLFPPASPFITAAIIGGSTTFVVVAM